MNRFLLIDLGATHIKSALVDINSGHFSRVATQPALANGAVNPGYYQIALSEIKQQFLTICAQYYDAGQDSFQGILLCSQMHGFALVDEKQQPLSDYISWKDERSLELIDGQSSFAIFTQVWGDKFKSITGMKPRPGLPCMNFFHLARQKNIQQKVYLITLPEWIALCAGESLQRIHNTMLAGLGFYDLNKQTLANELQQFIADYTGITPLFNTIATETEVAGFWHHRSQKIPIYVGCGDHQCALLGAGNDPHTLSINIGTGSQVSVVLEYILADHREYRPYFDDQVLATQTHIPAGRILSLYIQFLEEVCNSITGNKPDVWSVLSSISSEEILNSTLTIDLAVFKSAANYVDGGKISQITENNLNTRNYLASVLRCLLQQYVAFASRINLEERSLTALFSGGVARKLPALAHAFQAMAGLPVLNALTLDETLLGLRTQALRISGKIKNYQQAAELIKDIPRVTLISSPSS